MGVRGDPHRFLGKFWWVGRHTAGQVEDILVLLEVWETLGWDRCVKAVGSKVAVPKRTPAGPRSSTGWASTKFQKRCDKHTSDSFGLGGSGPETHSSSPRVKLNFCMDETAQLEASKQIVSGFFGAIELTPALGKLWEQDGDRSFI